MTVPPRRAHPAITGRVEALIALGGVARGGLHMWLCQDHSTMRHAIRDTAAKACYTPGRYSTQRRPGCNIQRHAVRDTATSCWDKSIRHGTRHKWGRNSLPHTSRCRTQCRRSPPDRHLGWHTRPARAGGGRGWACWPPSLGTATA